VHGIRIAVSWPSANAFRSGCRRSTVGFPEKRARLTRNDCLWVVVLAAGEGRRVRALTTDASGASVPKQYCTFGGHKSMLRWALDRALGLVPPQRIVTVVAQEHRRWWKRDLSVIPAENVIVQPRDQGTAVGILLGVLYALFRQGPQLRVLVQPSDHYVRDERILRRSLREAIGNVERDPDRAVLLGMAPDGFDGEYGWILPAPSGRARVRSVALFREKPDAATAAELRSRGGLLNTLLFTANAGTLLRLYERALPALLATFLAGVPRDVGWSPERLETVYRALSFHDFSRDVLERFPGELSVLPVPPCGWSDLGTPARLMHFLAGQGAQDSRLGPGAAAMGGL